VADSPRRLVFRARLPGPPQNHPRQAGGPFPVAQRHNRDWFGPHFISPVCDLPAAGRYAIYLEAIKGPAQAQVQLFQNENPVDAPADLYAEQPARSGRVFLGRLHLADGPNPLMFKLVGKNEKSAGLGWTW